MRWYSNILGDGFAQRRTVQSLVEGVFLVVEIVLREGVSKSLLGFSNYSFDLLSGSRIGGRRGILLSAQRIREWTGDYRGSLELAAAVQSGMQGILWAEKVKMAT